jgi:DNA-binding transcriptional ArsR family regulator
VSPKPPAAGAERRVQSNAPPETRVIRDPQAIRALAHPARLRVLERLREGSELTATECAAATGLSPSAMSYHLRALERWGFVERADSVDGRERPWRAIAQSWRIDAVPDPAMAAAADTMLGAMLAGVREAFSEWFDHEAAQPTAWQDAASINSATVWLTADEAAAINARHGAALANYQGRTADVHPDGARRVRIAQLVVPLEYE